MGASCICDAYAVTQLCKVKVDLFNSRGVGILKVNERKSANRADKLIHQAARLAEIDVFGILTDLCNFNCTCLTAVVVSVDYSANENFKCRRR